jgi:hypothetical protein
MFRWSKRRSRNEALKTGGKENVQPTETAMRRAELATERDAALSNNLDNRMRSLKSSRPLTEAVLLLQGVIIGTMMQHRTPEARALRLWASTQATTKATVGLIQDMPVAPRQVTQEAAIAVTEVVQIRPAAHALTSVAERIAESCLCHPRKPLLPLLPLLRLKKAREKEKARTKENRDKLGQIKTEKNGRRLGSASALTSARNPGVPLSTKRTPTLKFLP